MHSRGIPSSPTGSQPPDSLEGVERLPALFDVSHDAFMVVTENGFLDCNLRALEMFGVLDKASFRAIHPSDLSPSFQPGGRASLEAANESMRLALAQGSHRFEWVHRSCDGREFPAEVVLSTVRRDATPVLLVSVRDITYRKEAETILRRERDFSAGIIQGSPAVICGLTPEGRVTFLNPAGERITGYTSAEFQDLNWWTTLYPGADYQQVERLFEDFQKGNVADHEMTLTAKDGGRRVVSWNSINRVDEGGQLLEIIGFGIDVTEQRLAETAYRQSEERFRSLVEHLNEGFVVLDLDQRVTYVNPHMVKLMGYEEGEVLGSRWSRFLDPSTVSEFQVHMKRRREGISEHYDMHLIRKDGAHLLFTVSGNPLQDASGKVIGAYAILSDITEQRRLEGEMESGRARLKAVFENAGIGIAVLDLEGRYLQFNQRWLEFVGYTGEEMREFRNLDLTHREDLEATRNAMAQIRNGESKCTLLEKRFIRRDGQIVWGLISASAIRGWDGKAEAVIVMATDITARKKAEATIQKDEARLKALMAVHEGKVGTERELIELAIREAALLTESRVGCFLFLDQNQEPSERVAWSAGILAACPLHLNLAHANDWKDCIRLRVPIIRNDLENEQEGVEGHPPLHCHLSVPILDGSEVVAVVCVGNKPEGYEDLDARQLTLFMGGVWNRIRRDRAEAQLKESEERYRLFYREAPLGIFQMDETGVVCSCNDKLLEFFESSADRIVGLNLLTEIKNPGVLQALRDALEGRPGFYEGPYHSVTHGGTHKESYGRLFAYRLQSETGRRLGVYGIVEDLTGQKQSEMNVLRAEASYRHLFENALEGLYQSTADGRLIKVNPAVARILGYDSAEELMEALDSGISNNYADPSRREAFMQLMERNGSVHGFEFQAYRRDGSLVWLSDSAYTVKDPEGRTLYFAGFLEDVTVRKRENDLRVAKEAAEAANAAKSAFLAHMSHEIRTPLNAITGYSELLKDEIREPQARHFLNAIITSGRTLMSLISDILDLSRIEAGRLELQYGPVDPGAIAHEIRQMFALKCKEKGLKLEIDIDPSLPRALILDEVRFRQMLFNLVGNAVKFTERGSVHIGLHGRWDKDHISHVDLECAVSDTGLGIPADQQELVFESFRQQSGQDVSRYGGSGLGLAITRRLTEMMGGEIHLESRPGAGSTFTLRFPKVAVSPLEAREFLSEPEEEPDLDFDPADILLVDDVQTNRELLRSFMRNHPFRLHEAENGQEALEAAARCQPDLILMDLRMPVMDGREATRRLKNDPNLRHIPVVVLTASVLREDEAAVKECGVASLLRKPVSQSTLIRELGRHLPCRHLRAAPAKEASAPLLPEVLAALPELVSRLESAEMEQWEKLRHGFVFHRLAEFGQEIAELGQHYHVPSLKTWANTLLAQATTFDMEGMPGTLEGFPGVVAELREQIKNQGEGESR